MNKAYNPFSYDEYLAILRKYQGQILNPHSLDTKDGFTILRHDVEYSVERAHEMAVIESNLNISSNFFFQVSSEAYNITSIKNQNLIREIQEMGHNIGLHIYVSHLTPGDWNMLKEQLSFERKILDKVIGRASKYCSFHRPPKWTLENRNDELGGMISLYGESFFEFNADPKKIKYLADSMHKWNYGHPLEDYNFEKIQINIHPDHWTVIGHEDEGENFNALISENRHKFIDMLDSESNTFAGCLIK